MGYKVKEFLLIIPARCGSKGIKHKNIVDLNGRPLIYYTVKVAKKLQAMGIIDEIIISTDCEKIKLVCESLGVSIGELRDKKLSNDKSKTTDLVRSIINKKLIDNVHFKNILILQPTSPLRTLEQVYESIGVYKKQNANSLISVYRDSTLSDDIMYFKDDTYLVPKNSNHNSGKRRQENKVVFIRNGAIYIFKTKYFMEFNSIICDKPLHYEMDKITSVNIDNPIDLVLAKKLIS